MTEMCKCDGVVVIIVPRVICSDHVRLVWIFGDRYLGFVGYFRYC